MPFLTQDVLTDFGIVSFFIVLAQLLRARVKLLQDILMPSSLLAGVLCLILGKEGFGILLFSQKATGQTWMTEYTGFLVVLLFATLFLGKRAEKGNIKQTVEKVGDTFFFNLASLLGQYGMALLFGFLVIEPLFRQLPKGFGLFLPAGFVGGYGTAAAIGGFLERNGWEGATTIAYTSATIGILSAIVGGMVIINIATRRGYTRMVASASKMPESMRVGFIPEKERVSMGHETVSPMAIDSLTWHIAIVMVTALVAIWAKDIIKHFAAGYFEVPAFSLALLSGALIQYLLNRIGVGQYVDRQTMHRIGSWVTDYLVTFGIASITIKVVFDYAAPLSMLFIFGVAWVMFYSWFFGLRLCRNFWFERSVFVYGWNTGTVATSVMLLRVVDPDLRTKVIEDFGVSYFAISFVEISIIAFLPALIVNGVYVWPMISLLVAFVGCLILSRMLVGWSTPDPVTLRPGEAEVMAGKTEV